MNEIEKLTELFRKLGADDPEGWASSQVNEGINQLGRFILLREAWKRVISEDDDGWIDGELRSFERWRDKPGSGVGKALRSLLSNGCSRQDITDVVRGMQYELLFSLCYLLDGPQDLEPELEELSWGLMELNSAGEPVAYISALHESALSMDPTGREMRPRSSDDES